MFTLQVAKDCGKDSIPLADMAFNFQASETEAQSLFYFFMITNKVEINNFGNRKEQNIVSRSWAEVISFVSSRDNKIKS